MKKYKKIVIVEPIKNTSTTELRVSRDRLVALEDRNLPNVYDTEDDLVIGLREGGILSGKAFWLNTENYNYEIVVDDCGQTVLVPIKKK